MLLFFINTVQNENRFKPGMVVQTCHPSGIWEAEAGRSVPGQSGLNSGFKVNLKYMARPCLTKKKKKKGPDSLKMIH